MTKQYALAVLVFMLAPAPAFADGAVGDDLLGTQWTLRELNGEPSAAGVSTTLNFSADGIGGNGGCNTYGGSLAFPDGKLDISEIISTMMACDSPAMPQEQAFLAALDAATAYSITDGALILKDGDGDALAKLSPAR